MESSMSTNQNEKPLQIGEVRRRAILTLDVRAGKAGIREVLRKQGTAKLFMALCGLNAALSSFVSSHAEVIAGNERLTDDFKSSSRIALARVLIPLTQLSKLLKVKIPGLTKKLKSTLSVSDVLLPATHVCRSLSEIIATVTAGGKLPVADDFGGNKLADLVGQTATVLWSSCFALYGETPLVLGELTVSQLETAYGAEFFVKKPKPPRVAKPKPVQASSTEPDPIPVANVCETDQPAPEPPQEPTAEQVSTVL